MLLVARGRSCPPLGYGTVRWGKPQAAIYPGGGYERMVNVWETPRMV